MTTRRTVSSALLLLAPIIVVLAAWRGHGEVPDPLPTHWDLHGQVDGTTGFAGFTTGVLVVSLVAALVGLVLIWQAAWARAVAGILFGWIAWLFALLYAGTLVASADAVRAQDVDLPWWLLVVSLGVPGVVAVVLYLLLPPRPAFSAIPTPALDLAPDERAVWFGSARSTALAWLGAVMAIAGAVVLFFEPTTGIILLVTGLVVWWVHVLSVRVDATGVRATFGPAGWPGIRVPIGRLAAAEAIELHPTEWGGWGYRVSPRGTAFVVRRGPAIVLHRDSATDLAVTVDGAADAAALVNALVQRAAADPR